MRSVYLIALLTSAAACSGDKSEQHRLSISNACITEGQAEKLCLCRAGAFLNNLEKNTLNELASSAENQDPLTEDKILAGLVSDNPELSKKLLTDLMNCEAL